METRCPWPMATRRKGNPPRKGIIMHIVSVVTDGHDHVRLAATRAPDLFRRNVAAETGSARLIWCGVAPPQLGARKFVERLQYAWRDCRICDGTYRISPDAAVRAVYRELIFHRIGRITNAAVRSLRQLIFRGRSARGA
jgi:hypothetical protein